MGISCHWNQLYSVVVIFTITVVTLVHRLESLHSACSLKKMRFLGRPQVFLRPEGPVYVEGQAGCGGTWWEIELFLGNREGGFWLNEGTMPIVMSSRDGLSTVRMAAWS